MRKYVRERHYMFYMYGRKNIPIALTSYCLPLAAIMLTNYSPYTFGWWQKWTVIPITDIWPLHKLTPTTPMVLCNSNLKVGHNLHLLTLTDMASYMFVPTNASSCLSLGCTSTGEAMSCHAFWKTGEVEGVAPVGLLGSVHSLQSQWVEWGWGRGAWLEAEWVWETDPTQEGGVKS